MKPASEASAIEAFPHVRNRICMLWGTHDLDQYITHLMTDTRDGQRKGFPVDATAELLMLIELDRLVHAMALAEERQISLTDAYHELDRQELAGQAGNLAVKEMPWQNDEPLGRKGRVDREVGSQQHKEKPREQPRENARASLREWAEKNDLFVKVALVLFALIALWKLILSLIFR